MQSTERLQICQVGGADWIIEVTRSHYSTDNVEIMSYSSNSTKLIFFAI